MDATNADHYVAVAVHDLSLIIDNTEEWSDGMRECIMHALAYEFGYSHVTTTDEFRFAKTYDVVCTIKSAITDWLMDMIESDTAPDSFARLLLMQGFIDNPILEAFARESIPSWQDYAEWRESETGEIEE